MTNKNIRQSGLSILRQHLTTWAGEDFKLKMKLPGIIDNNEKQITITVKFANNRLDLCGFREHISDVVFLIFINKTHCKTVEDIESTYIHEITHVLQDLDNRVEKWYIASNSNEPYHVWESKFGYDNDPTEQECALAELYQDILDERAKPFPLEKINKLCANYFEITQTDFICAGVEYGVAESTLNKFLTR